MKNVFLIFLVTIHVFLATELKAKQISGGVLWRGIEFGMTFEDIRKMFPDSKLCNSSDYFVRSDEVCLKLKPEPIDYLTYEPIVGFRNGLVDQVMLNSELLSNQYQEYIKAMVYPIVADSISADLGKEPYFCDTSDIGGNGYSKTCKWRKDSLVVSVTHTNNQVSKAHFLRISHKVESLTIIGKF